RRARPSGQRLLGDRRRRHPLPPHRAHRTDRCGALSRGLMAVSLALLAIRVLSAAFVVIQPGFTDPFYYVYVVSRIHHGQGLVAAALAGLGGGAFAPAWVTLDSFAIAALIGTGFFIFFARAATGDARAGAISGLLVGLLFLARAEGALFGVALLALAIRPSSR